MTTDQNNQENPTAPTILPAKRRRGRPRKDEGPPKRMMLQTPSPEMRQRDITTDDNMLGQIVSGVIDGSFDAGYFLSVKLGNNNNNATTLRGLIFEPGRFSPITAANDIAPQVKMHHRSQVITLQDQQNSTNKQQLNVSPEHDHSLVRSNNLRANTDLMLKHQSQFNPLLENLRMVEQDEVMEVFEVANQPEGLETKAQLMDSNSMIQTGTLVCSDLNNNSKDDNHHNNNNNNNVVIDESQEIGSDEKQMESDQVEKNKSNLETLLHQPTELVHCELKKLEIHRGPIIDDQTQLIKTINPELEPKDLSQNGQDFQPHQTPPFVELNVEAHYVDMPQHNITSDTQVLHQQSISESVDITMETRNSPQSSDVGEEVKVVGKEETSHERI